MAQTTQVRASRITVGLTPEVHAKLERLSQEYGIAPAMLASMLVGQGVAAQWRQIAVAERMADVALESLPDALRAAMTAGDD